MMKEKIENIIGKNVTFKVLETPKTIYVMDYTERTRGERAIIVGEEKPADTDLLTIENTPNISVTSAIFSNHGFEDNSGKEIKRCECVLFPTQNDDKTWVLFIEIKDCKAKNCKKHAKTAIIQLIETVKYFRENALLPPMKKAYAVVSYPRRKVYHNNFITTDEAKKIYDKHKILIRATNNIQIENTNTISYQ